ncbi:MAG: potassium transporter KefA [Planctomycetota bacterium]|nr:MAG: potassium transporter KefA [Planctomycetota bacterium]REK17538.1 MAG: potassium transporter KefA [Planctomycetota bacterium]REK47447.1 MAG: potassium transporter KefA [Planctomycetota bacterium]
MANSMVPHHSCRFANCAQISRCWSRPFLERNAMWSHPQIFAALALSLGYVIAGSAAGQEPASETVAAESAATEVTAADIERVQRDAAALSDLDDDVKTKVVDLCRSASEELRRANELKARIVQLKSDTDGAKQRVTRIRQQLEQIQDRQPLPPQATLLPDLEQALAKLESRLAELRKSKKDVEVEVAARAKRRVEIRSALAAASEKVIELRKQLGALPPGEPPLLSAARRVELRARQLVAELESPALEAELAKYDAEEATNLLRLQRDLRTQEVALAERELALLADQVKTARASAAQIAVEQARDEAVVVDPLLRSYADRNQQLAEAVKSLTRRIEDVEAEAKTSQETHSSLRKQFDKTRKKVETVGLNSSIGVLLRRQRIALADPSQWRVAIHDRQQRIDEAQYDLLEYDEERQELADPDAIIQEILTQASTSKPDKLQTSAREILARQREHLDALTRSYNTYLDTLIELDTTEQTIIKLTKQYEEFINQRVLWIRSGGLLTSELQFDSSDAWLLSSSRWAGVPQALWRDVQGNWLIYLAVAGIAGALLLYRPQLHRELSTIAESVQRPAFYQFLPTLRAGLVTIGLAICLPGVVGFFAWRIDTAAGDAPFVKAIAQGLWHTSLAWFPVELSRQICQSSGLGEVHFGWPTSAVKLLRRNLRSLIALGAPLIFITSTLAAFDPTHGHDAIERICFIAGAIVLAVFLRRLFRPVGGVFEEYLAYHQGGWIDRLKNTWYVLGMLLPLSLAGLAFWGYYYTAQILAWRLHATICFVGTLILIRAILRRLIVLRHRKLSIEQSQRRAAERAAIEGTAAEAAAIPVEEPVSDVSAHSAQTQRMLGTGMVVASLVGFWLIWVEVLPALNMLDRWPLWTTTVHVTENAVGDSGITSRVVESLEAITLVNVACALLIVGTTIFMARNVPGLLEMLLLQPLPLEASIRYAITTLTSYGIIMVGVISACSSIGLQWSQIQWLATALTFGLAFGLQEMFANFVSGLIILFERPIRVGDVVTVGDVTGIVSRIRIRATSITNWDRKEFIVPNKEFITGRVLNWTLSDNVNRIVINVGIAYGSDSEAARDLLLEVANEHPLTLKEPPSLATFEGFGDNSLNFVLRTFLPSMENRLQVIHELHTAIDKAFREAGIEIAFPQRDLHIRSVPAAWQGVVAVDSARDYGHRQDAA